MTALKPCPFCGCDIGVSGGPITSDIKKAIHPTNDCLLAGEAWWYIPHFIDPWNTRDDLHDATKAQLAKAIEALEWYAEQTRLCRLIHSEGDSGRHALQADGGEKACAVLAKIEKGGA